MVVGPATTIGEFGVPLWEHGLSLVNQGDIVAQQIAGAVSTATHGSGLRLGSFSSGVRRIRLVTAGGAIVEIGEDEPERLHAAQVGVGMLGAIVELELEVAAAYRLSERIEHWSWDEAWGSFDELAQDASPLLVLLDAVGGLGRALRARAARCLARRPLPREDLRRGGCFGRRLR